MAFEILAVCSVWWVICFTFWAIVYAALGVALLLVHLVGTMVRSVARLGDGAYPVQSSRVDSAGAVSQSASGQGRRLCRRLRCGGSFPDVAISVREAREALFAHEQRVFRARSEVREAAARTLETIAQTQAPMAQVDAAAAGPVVPVAIAPGAIVFMEPSVAAMEINYVYMEREIIVRE
jgi:hypothetical protein